MKNESFVTLFVALAALAVTVGLLWVIIDGFPS
jgi:hypothetical protein